MIMPPMLFPRLPTAMKRALRRMPQSAGVFLRLRNRAAMREGARLGLQVQLTYHKKSTDSVVRRMVSPYEIKKGKLYAKHRHTKSFIVNRIQDAVVTDVAAKPDYPVKL